MNDKKIYCCCCKKRIYSYVIISTAGYINMCGKCALEYIKDSFN